MAIINVTLNPNDAGVGHVLSNGNLTDTVATTSNIRATHSKTKGKWYWEVRFISGNAALAMGISDSKYPIASNTWNTNAGDSLLLRGYYGLASKFPENTSYGSSWVANDVIGIALDLDDFALTFYKNGVSMGASHTNLNGLGEVFPFFRSANTVSKVFTVNFGSTPFAYTVPSGYTAYNRYIQNKVLLKSQNKYYSLTSTVPVQLQEFNFEPTEQTYISKGLQKSTVVNFNQSITQKQIFSTDSASPDSVVSEQFNLSSFFGGKDLSIIEYTDDTSQTESAITISTDPFTLYDELGSTTNILYYTDDISKTQATISVNANYSSLDDLSNPTLLAYSGVQSDLHDKVLKTEAIGNPVLIKQTRDYSTNQLKSMLLTTLESGYGRLKIIVSGDMGLSWKTIQVLSDGSKIIRDIDISNIENIKQFGTSASTFSSLAEAEWTQISPNANYRFAYYLEEFRTSDVAQIERVVTNEKAVTESPQISNINIIYDAIDKKYSGLMFMDSQEQYYTTALGELLKYLDFGTLIVGQTSLDVKVILTNTYPDSVKNIQITSQHNISGLNVQFSLSNNPFNARSTLLIPGPLLLGEQTEFYVRLNVAGNAESGGVFNIQAKSEFA